tara:strand:- start:172 stop:564 length:393 start_codon:yes stop_codon:yes gene_type:complete
MNDQINIPISPGEVIDKITILEIKKDFIDDKTKLLNVNNEYELLIGIYIQKLKSIAGIEKLKDQLKYINLSLWKIEDDIRECERKKRFDQTFIDLARSVYVTNDERSKIKKKINMLLNSNLIEEKSYKDY